MIIKDDETESLKPCFDATNIHIKQVFFKKYIEMAFRKLKMKICILDYATILFIIYGL
jgi:hypothetical protein